RSAPTRSRLSRGRAQRRFAPEGRNSFAGIGRLDPSCDGCMKQPSNNTHATYPTRLYLVPSLAPPRRTLSPRLGYAVAALVVGLGLFAAVNPSPLYRAYRILSHFSPPPLTRSYPTYP